MAYVGGPFTHDLFVTYSHGDPDDTGVSKLRQWSQGFARELESELKAYPKFGRDLRIFLDQHPHPAQGVDPMSALTDQLRDDIGKSALLVVLMSPHYLQSGWCKDERDWWCGRQPELGLPTDGRIAVVRIWPTEESWPGALVDRRGQELVGFFFYDREHADARPQPYDWPEPGPSSKDPFRNELLTLVRWLGLKLEDTHKRIEEQARAAAEAARLAAPGGQLIYLHGRTENAASWQAAREALRQTGFAVMPGDPDPIVSDTKTLLEIRQRRVETMSGCDALLLLAGDNGRAVDADLVVVGRQDRHSARAISSRLLPCALLDRAGVAAATPTRRVAARDLNVEWIDATREPWTPAVQQWLVDSSKVEALR